MTMKAITQHFIGTTDEWESCNPRLYKAVLGFEETANGKVWVKLGDGLHNWQALPYILDVTTIKGLPEALAAFQAAVNPALQEEAQTRSQAINQVNQAITLETSERKTDVLSLERSLVKETEARQTLQQIVGTLLEFVRQHVGPIRPSILVSQDGKIIVSQDGKRIISRLALNNLV
jgi:hypothetical protein